MRGRRRRLQRGEPRVAPAAALAAAAAANPATPAAFGGRGAVP